MYEASCILTSERRIGTLVRVLVVKLTSLGDIVFNLPVVHDIQTYWPGAEIDWAVDTRFEELPRACAGINQVFAFPFRGRHAFSRLSFFNEAHQAFRALRAHRYDAVIDTQGVIKSSFVGLMARAQHKYSYHRSQMAEPLLSWVYNRKIDRHRGLNVLARYRQQVGEALGFEPSGNPDFGFVGAYRSLKSDQTQSVERERALLTVRPTIVLFPFASKAQKCIPSVVYQSLIHHLEAMGYAVAIPSGSLAETQQAQQVIEGTQARLMPRLSIAQLIAVLGQARGFVGADTGPTHLAAAVGLPTVAVFRATSLARLGPHLWATHARSVDLANVFSAWHTNVGSSCVEQSVAIIGAALDQVLEKSPRNERH